MNAKIFTPKAKKNQLLWTCALLGLALSASSLQAQTLPTAVTQPASDVSSVGAALNGTVTPNGDPTTYWFEYGLDTAYGQTTPQSVLSVTNGSVSVQARISGLSPVTTYHFRLVANNSFGGTVGRDFVFTTGGPTPCSGGPCYLQNVNQYNVNYTLYLQYRNTSWAYNYFFLGQAVPYLNYYYAGYLGNNFCCAGSLGAMSGVGSAYFDYFADLGDYYWRTY